LDERSAVIRRETVGRQRNVRRRKDRERGEYEDMHGFGNLDFVGFCLDRLEGVSCMNRAILLSCHLVVNRLS